MTRRPSTHTLGWSRTLLDRYSLLLPSHHRILLSIGSLPMDSVTSLSSFGRLQNVIHTAGSRSRFPMDYHFPELLGLASDPTHDWYHRLEDPRLPTRLVHPSQPRGQPIASLLKTLAYTGLVHPRQLTTRFVQSSPTAHTRLVISLLYMVPVKLSVTHTLYTPTKSCTSHWIL